MTIIFRPPVGGLGMQDLLATLDAMRSQEDPPVRTGNGGFVVGEDLASRFLAALALVRHPTPLPAQPPQPVQPPLPAAITEPAPAPRTPQPEPAAPQPPPAPQTRRRTTTTARRRN